MAFVFGLMAISYKGASWGFLAEIRNPALEDEGQSGSDENHGIRGAGQGLVEQAGNVALLSEPSARSRQRMRAPKRRKSWRVRISVTTLRISATRYETRAP